MVQEKVTRGETVAVDEDEMVRAGNPHRVIQDDISAPSPVFVPKMNDGELVAEARLGDDIGDGRAGPVIGDESSKSVKDCREAAARTSRRFSGLLYTAVMRLSAGG